MSDDEKEMAAAREYLGGILAEFPFSQMVTIPYVQLESLVLCLERCRGTIEHLPDELPEDALPEEVVRVLMKSMSLAARTLAKWGFPQTVDYWAKVSAYQAPGERGE